MYLLLKIMVFVAEKLNWLSSEQYIKAKLSIFNVVNVELLAIRLLI